MIVSPILAVLSYYLVDLVVKEKPQKALTGQAYKLIPKSNCRFSSGACDMQNGDFKSTVKIVQADNKRTLLLDTNHPLEQASVGFVRNDGQESGPFELAPNDSLNKQWTVDLTNQTDADTTLRVVLSADGAHYYSETGMAFSTYETTFNKDFRK